MGKANDENSAKSVVFTVDVSGSMRGSRIERARDNLLKIFDEYIEDEDQLSMITFDDRTTEIFPLQEVGMSRDRLRREASDACRVQGGTAFYDALIKSSESLKDGLPESQQWIIAITDGADQHSRNTLEQALAKVQASPGKPNLIIVGIELSSSYKPLMEKLTTVTESSVFIDASGGLQSLNEAFQQVAELIFIMKILGGVASPELHTCEEEGLCSRIWLHTHVVLSSVGTDCTVPSLSLVH